MLTMHNGLHPKSNIDRLYLSRIESGRGLIGVQDTRETAIFRLRNYKRNRKERLLIAAHTIEKDEDRETSNEYKKRKNNERKKPWTQNNYMDNLSGKQWAKQVKISEDGLNNGCTGTGYKNQ